MNNNKNKTVVVAMSGGVDSSVAAALLKDEGYNLIGITMKTWGFDDFPLKDSGCCSLDAIYNARNVAAKLGIPHYTFDFTERFNETVIDNFIKEYMAGHTPNPCVLCNKTIKWGVLLDRAKELGADFIATGHYARVNKDKSTRRFYVSNSHDTNKDQTYALWQVTQEGLSMTLFPLGDYTKPETRKIAEKLGLKTAHEPDSQEICFVPNNDYRELLEIRVPGLREKLENGDIVYHDKKIGTHKGFPYYTIGQRRGINVAAGKPLYVSRIDSDTNTIYVDDESGLYNKTFVAKNVNMMKYEMLSAPLKANVKIRYKDPGSMATIEQISKSTIKVTFDEPKKSITPGQSAVFYEDKDVIGGGIISIDD